MIPTGDTRASEDANTCLLNEMTCQSIQALLVGASHPAARAKPRLLSRSCEKS